MKTANILLICLFLTSCISTQVRDFTDPDYINYTAKKLLIDAPSPFFEESFSYKLKDIDVQYAPTTNLFLPTRTYTAEEKVEIIRRNGFDSLLIISISGDNQSSDVVGYNTNSYANAYSTGYGNAYASGASTTVPIVSNNRNTQAQAKLYDTKNGRIIWVGNLNTKASGSLYMSNSSTVNSMTKEIINSLLQKRHLIKKTPNK